MEASVLEKVVDKKVAAQVEVSASSSVEVIEAQGFDQQTTKKLIRKIDWHLIPFLSLIYL
jgi:hypothetical protein